MMEQSSSLLIQLKTQPMLILFSAGHHAKDSEQKHLTSSQVLFKDQLVLNRSKMKDIYLMVVVEYYPLASKLTKMHRWIAFITMVASSLVRCNIFRG
jgi:hypothetical protein